MKSLKLTLIMLCPLALQAGFVGPTLGPNFPGAASERTALVELWNNTFPSGVLGPLSVDTLTFLKLADDGSIDDKLGSGPTADITITGQDTLSGTWTSDIPILGFLVKNAAQTNSYVSELGATTGSWESPRNPGFSHMSFIYLNSTPAIPEPSGLLFGFTAVGIGMILLGRRRRRRHS